jgi:fructose-bisphosphate aldolase, class I
LYGVPEAAYSNDDALFALMPKMRSRIIASPRFGGDRILGAILFENTLDREIQGRESTEYLWTVKNVVPFVKVDKGLVEEFDGVQVMKPMPDLDALRARPSDKGVFGTKVRSVIKLADDCGVKSVVDQQFDVARRILQAGLAPIIEPRIDIHSPQKAEAEALLKAVLLEQLGQLASDQYVMLKLTLPELNDFSTDLVKHPKRSAGLCPSAAATPQRGGRPSRGQPRRGASLSQALTEGLSAQQNDKKFDATLNDSIASIFEASIT